MSVRPSVPSLCLDNSARLLLAIDTVDFVATFRSSPDATVDRARRGDGPWSIGHPLSERYRLALRASTATNWFGMGGAEFARPYNDDLTTTDQMTGLENTRRDNDGAIITNESLHLVFLYFNSLHVRVVKCLFGINCSWILVFMCFVSSSNVFVSLLVRYRHDTMYYMLLWLVVACNVIHFCEAERRHSFIYYYSVYTHRMRYTWQHIKNNLNSYIDARLPCRPAFVLWWFQLKARQRSG